MPVPQAVFSKTAASAQRPFINVQNNKDLEAQKKYEEEVATAERGDESEEKTALLGYLERLWEEAKTYKEETGIHDEMIRNLRQRDGEYEPDILADIAEQGGTDLFLGLTDVKCRAAEAWLNDVLNADHDKSWTLTPTPLPELPEELEQGIVKETMEQVIQNVMQGGEPLELQEIQDYAADMRQSIDEQLYAEAEDRVGRMEVVINDQMVEGNWQDAWDDFVSNLVTLKNGFIEGPIVRRKKKLNWVKKKGKSVPEVTTELTVEFDAPNPLDIFEARGMTNTDDGTLIKRIRFQRLDLERMKGTEGYDDDAITLVLNYFGETGYSNYTGNDDARKNLTDKGWDTKFTPDSIEGLEYWTSAQGKMLIDVGMVNDPDGKAIVPLDEYEINAIRIGPYLIYKAINDDPLGRRRIYKSGWAKVPGSFWYKGVPELMADLQRICNSSIRAMINNQSMASGSQYIYSDISRLPPGEDIEESYPGKVHQFTSIGAGVEKPLYTLDVPSHATELMGIYTAFANLADEYTGIPAYEHGQGTHVGGAGRALANYEEILTPNGPKIIGDVKPGDRVCNTYGKASTVLAVYPQGDRDLVRLTFTNGTHVDCDMEHRWSVTTHPERKKFRTLTTRQILDKGLFRKTKKDERNPKGFRPKWALPKVDGVEFNQRDVAIDPYTMGVLLGNGDSRCRVTGMDDEVFSRIPYELGKIDNKTDDNKAITRTVKGIKGDYHKYGLNCKSPEKFIPVDYLYNSKDVRLELLRGIMDTDGCASTDGEKVFLSTTSEKLANDFEALVKSLGATNVCRSINKAHMSHIQGRDAYSMRCFRINFMLTGVHVFHLERKRSLVRDRREHSIYISGVESIGSSPATCITVDATDHLFICANGIPTHNTLGGLSMLMTNAARGIKLVIMRVDKNVLRPSIQGTYEFNMLYHPDETIKGDVEVQPEGILARIIKEQLMQRRIEFLNATNNETDQKLTGLEGRATVLREAAKSLDMRAAGVVRSKEKVEEIEAKEEAMKEQMLQVQMQQILAAGQGAPQAGG